MERKRNSARRKQKSKSSREPLPPLLLVLLHGREIHISKVCHVTLLFLSSSLMDESPFSLPPFPLCLYYSSPPSHPTANKERERDCWRSSRRQECRCVGRGPQDTSYRLASTLHWAWGQKAAAHSNPVKAILVKTALTNTLPISPQVKMSFDFNGVR